MSSRSRIELAALALLALGGCHRQAREQPRAAPDRPGVIASALLPGELASLVTNDRRADAYYDNAAAVNEGMRLYKAYNCNGCHSAGGGGMGPSLMDKEWIYGGRLAQIHQTLVEGRPNGMPSWGGKVPDDELWKIATYVRSLSLPATIAANTGETPGQHPAPVPKSADDHNGWSPPPKTTNDFGSTTEGAR
ncbi:MAG: cytochrome c [Proteobacteria bacterium]|nr:cytochrome c [Pseudomonadota bacterium]